MRLDGHGAHAIDQ